MGSPFKKATREGSRIRVLLMGVSGSGKTYSALALACHMAGPGGRVAVIDTEKDSARKYAGTEGRPSNCLCSGCRGHGATLDFDAMSLDRHGPNDYMDAMRAAHGYDVLVIDSLSHEWEGNGGVLQQVDAAKSHAKNQISPWAKPSLAHDQFLQAIIAWPGHVVATVRAKDRIDVKTGNSKGVTPIQRDGLEYEFDFVTFMSGGRGELVKSRAPHLQGQLYQHPGKDMANALTEWAGEVAPGPSPEIGQLQEDARAKLKELLPCLPEHVIEAVDFDVANSRPYTEILSCVEGFLSNQPVGDGAVTTEGSPVPGATRDKISGAISEEPVVQAAAEKLGGKEV